MTSRIREMFQGKEEPIYSQHYAQTHHGNLPILELTVPMCCNKCEEKVKEELEELSGVRSVTTDQYNQRVTVLGHVDPLLALRKVKKVKKKSQFFKSGSYISGGGVVVPHSAPASTTSYTGRGYVHGSSDGAAGLMRSNSFERRLGKLPSFGRVIRYDNQRDPHRQTLHGYDDHFQHYRSDGYRHEFSKDHHNDPYHQRDYYDVRRMPSFKKHRYHDAEYISMDDSYNRQTASSLPNYHYGDSHYVAHHLQQPAFRSQVSFSKLPVTNPYYMKSIEY